MLSVYQTNDIAMWSVKSLITVGLGETVATTLKTIFNNGDLSDILDKKILVKILSLVIGWVFYIIVVKKILSNITIPVPEWADSGVADIIKYGTAIIIARVVEQGLNNEKIFDGNWFKYLILLMIGFLIVNILIHFIFYRVSPELKNANRDMFLKTVDVFKGIFTFTFANLIAHRGDFLNKNKHFELIGVIVGWSAFNYVAADIVLSRT
jgi:hypothetical protein